MNRRFILKAMAGCLTAATAGVGYSVAKQISPASENFNAAAYIDDMMTSTDKSLHPAILVRTGRAIGYCGWLPENIDGDRDGSKCRAFIAELKRRRWYRDDTTGHRLPTSTPVYYPNRPIWQ